jgi:hypothetical protein
MIAWIADTAKFLDEHNWLVNALFAGLLTLFTWRLWRATTDLRDSTEKLWTAGEKQTAVAERQAKIAEDVFVKLERPYIFVFGAKGFEVDPEDPDQGAFAKYQVANYGKTPAVIENVRAEISMSDAGGPDNPMRVNDDCELFHASVVAPLFSYSLTQHESTGIEFYRHESLAEPNADFGRRELFFRVIVNYRGAFTEGHETSACWRYDQELRSFIQYGHGDYNYVR